MFTKLDHIGIAVKNIDEALRVFSEIFGLDCDVIEEVQEQKVKVAMLPLGETRLELLMSTDPAGPVAKFIERKGEGVQHLAFKVENIERALEELKAKNVPLINPEPRIGAHGAKIAFVHPKATHGVLVELCERN